MTATGDGRSPADAVSDRRFPAVLHCCRGGDGAAAPPLCSPQAGAGCHQLRVLRPVELALLPAAGVQFDRYISRRQADRRCRGAEVAPTGRRRRGNGSSRAFSASSNTSTSLSGPSTTLRISLGLERDLPFVEIILPVGISFFTFHGISYVVDVYRGDVPVCRRLTEMLLYLSFFPQLVAGPIVRASFFLPQLYRAPRETLATRPAADADPGRAVQEGRGRELSSDGPRRSGIFRSRQLRNFGSSAGGVRLCDPDLLRFQRLQRHGHRPRGAAGLPLSAEFRPALPRRQPAGILAALAHFAVVMAARLPLQAARRQPAADAGSPCGT